MDDLPDSVVLALAAPDASFEFFDWSFAGVQSFFPLWPQQGAKWCVEACHPPDFLLKSRP